MSPDDVDNMKVLDFVKFVQGIDKLRADIAAHNRAVEEYNNA